MKTNIHNQLISIGWRLVKVFSFCVLVIISLAIAFKAVDYIQADFTSGFLRGKENYFYKGYNIALYTHAIAATTALLISSILLFFRLEYQYKITHRSLGKIYVVLVLLFGFPSGFVLSFKAIGGTWSVVNFLLLSLLWAATTYMAWQKAKSKDFRSHKKWMFRSYLLVISAPLLRIYGFILLHYFQMEATESYVWAAWWSWLPQVVLFELFLKFKH